MTHIDHYDDSLEDGNKISEPQPSNIEKANDIIETLLEAVPKQLPDADWWEDNLTNAVHNAKTWLEEYKSQEAELETFKDAYIERNDAYNRLQIEMQELRKEFKHYLKFVEVDNNLSDSEYDEFCNVRNKMYELKIFP